jgi:CMP/dCMP kinase
VAARAARRTAELSGADEQDTLRDLDRRDRADSGRAAAPLTMAVDAHHIDTTPYTLEQVVDQVVALVEKARETTSP